MGQRFNYRHLYYFWVVAHEGGIARAAARLQMAVQTVSTQVRALERDLGYALFKPAGRGLALTDAGHAAVREADQIFQLGELLPGAVRDAATAPALRLAVGVADALPKLVVHRLLKPALGSPHLKLRCHVGQFEPLLAELALHRLDLVLADRAPPARGPMRLYAHALGSSPIAWYAPAALAAAARRGFPQSLATVPVLLPTAHAAVRPALDRWLERLAIAPRVAGEFEDSALLKAFGAGGLGVFPAPALVHDELVARYAVRRVGTSEGVEEQLYAIGTEKRVQHPLVQRLLGAAA